MAETGDHHPDRGRRSTRPQLPEFPEVKINERYGGPKGFLLKMVETGAQSRPASTEPRSAAAGSRSPRRSTRRLRTRRSRRPRTTPSRPPTPSTRRPRNLHAAIASVDVGTGEVLALYGGPDYVKNSRNWATTAAPDRLDLQGVRAGRRPGRRLQPQLHGSTATPSPRRATAPRSATSISYQYGSAVTLLRATTDSINTAFVDLVTPDGPTGRRR